MLENWKILEFLIEKGADVNAQNGIPLLNTSIDGGYNATRVLLEGGADVHAMDDLALINAAKNIYFGGGVIKLLLRYGANPHAQNDIILKNAIKNNDSQAIKFWSQF